MAPGQEREWNLVTVESYVAERRTSDEVFNTVDAYGRNLHTKGGANYSYSLVRNYLVGSQKKTRASMDCGCRGHGDFDACVHGCSTHVCT